MRTLKNKIFILLLDSFLLALIVLNYNIIMTLLSLLLLALNIENTLKTIL